jgi:hypothetical protein
MYYNTMGWLASKSTLFVDKVVKSDHKDGVKRKESWM